MALCNDAIFMVDPIDDLNKYYTQRQRWQIGELEVLKMFVLKRMNKFSNVFSDSSLRVLVVDHTISFTKFVWMAVMIVLCVTNGMFKIIFAATVMLYLLSVFSSYMYAINVIQFLKNFPSIKQYYINNLGYIVLLPVYNIFAFFVRVCGIVNSINRKASWKTKTFTEEKSEIDDTVKNDFRIIPRISLGLRKLIEREEDGISV